MLVSFHDFNHFTSHLLTEIPLRKGSLCPTDLLEYHIAYDQGEKDREQMFASIPLLMNLSNDPGFNLAVLQENLPVDSNEAGLQWSVDIPRNLVHNLPDSCHFPMHTPKVLLGTGNSRGPLCGQCQLLHCPCMHQHLHGHRHTLPPDATCVAAADLTEQKNLHLWSVSAGWICLRNCALSH